MKTSSKKDIRLLDARTITIGKDWNFRGVYSSFWRLYCNRDEGAAVSWNGGNSTLQPGRLYLLPPWFPFHCQNRQNRVRHTYAHFEISGLPPLTVKEAFREPLEINNPPQLEPLVETWHAWMEQPSLHSQAGSTFTLGLVHLLWAELLRQGHLSGNPFPVSDPRIRKALARMEEAYDQPLTVPELARHCALSEDHFARSFRRELGIPPHRYLRELRVREASRLLAFTNLPIESIADSCGFPDRYTFTKAFTRMMGTPPARYRRREFAARKASVAKLG